MPGVHRIRAIWVHPWQGIVFPLTRMERKKKRQNHDDSAVSSQGGHSDDFIFMPLFEYAKIFVRLTFDFLKTP